MYISAARVCHMYYMGGLTQQQIASELGISRIRVSRILQQARQDHTVQITIRYDGYFRKLEESLADQYPGVRFIVCDSLDGSPEAIVDSLGATVADYLAALEIGDTVAVGWGTTIHSVASQMPAIDRPELTFVPMIGGQGHARLDLHATQISALLAKSAGGSFLPLLAPAVAASVEERDAIAATAEVGTVLATAAKADTALFSVGAPLSPTASLRWAGYFTGEDIDLLVAEGARSDVVSLCYLNDKGEDCALALSRRAVAIAREELLKIPKRICVAGGSEKHEPVFLALRRGFATVLVTDETTAQSLVGRRAKTGG
jgi:deoxyribonucleoside regulator